MNTPDLNSFIQFFLNMFDQLVSLLSSVYFYIGGYRVSYFWFVVAFLLLSIVVSLFWRGGKA